MGALRAIGVSQAAPPAPIATLPKRAAGQTWEQSILAQPSAWPARVVELAEAIARERAALLFTLERIAVRMPDLDARLAALAGSPGEEAFELAGERAALLAIRREAEAGLIGLSSALLPAQAAKRAAAREQRDRFISMRCRDESESGARMAAKFEAEGDHRQARIWRLEGIGLRQRIEKESR